MKSYFHSETTSWTSKPAKGKQYGHRNIVNIKNGKGTKTVVNLNAKGKPTKSKTVKLSRGEARNAIKGKFMSGFWGNCNVGNC